MQLATNLRRKNNQFRVKFNKINHTLEWAGFSNSVDNNIDHPILFNSVKNFHLDTVWSKQLPMLANDDGRQENVCFTAKDQKRPPSLMLFNIYRRYVDDLLLLQCNCPELDTHFSNQRFRYENAER